MKKSLLLITLSALLFIAGCSTTSVPSTPKPHPEKYALQVLLIETPAIGTEPTSAYVPAPTRNIEALLKNPNATVTELPIVYAAIGETAINDQTKTISAPKNYELKTDTNGVIRVVYDNATAKVGQYVEMTLKKVENDEATFDLLFYEKSLQGMQRYDISPATESQDALTAFMPIFKMYKTDTDITLALESWLQMGGLIRETVQGINTGKETKTAIEKHTFIRILPPKGVPVNPPKIDPTAYRFTPNNLTSPTVEPIKVPTAPTTNLETTNLHPEKHTLRFVLASGTGKLFESKEAFFEMLNDPNENLAPNDWSYFSGKPFKGCPKSPPKSVFPLILKKADAIYTELFSASIDLGQGFSSADKTLNGKIWQKSDITTSDTTRDSFISFNLQLPEHDHPLELTEFHLKPNGWSSIVIERTNRVEVLLVRLYEPQEPAKAQ